jgi:RNA polymerase sigma-70 factor (ECF subfamily)
LISAIPRQKSLCIGLQLWPGLCASPVKNSFSKRLVVDYQSPRFREPKSTILDSINPTFRRAGPLLPAHLHSLPDEQLMACLQEGQGDALAVLFDRYQKLVLSIALKIVRDPGEAEDVTQTVFLDVYRAVAQFDPRKGSTKVWLMQYAYHRAINRRQHLQGRDFYKITELEEETLETRPVEARTTFGLSSAQTKALIRQSMAALSNTQKSVIEMACYEGLSMREIADRTGVSFVNVRHQYYRGLQKLRSLISGADERKPADDGEKCA